MKPRIHMKTTKGILPFEIDIYYKNFKSMSIPWYLKFLLWFKPYYIGTDFGVEGGDMTYTVRCKQLFGKTYILKEEFNREEEDEKKRR